jgi:polysaccharide biosynthesis/export protein
MAVSKDLGDEKTMKLLHRRFILSLCCLLLTASIGHAQSTSGQNKDDEPKLKTPSENRYRLVSGDVIDVIYRYTPEFNQTVTIQPDGYVVLEIVGELKAAGLTLAEARRQITEKAGARLKDPEVTLLLKEFQKPYFVVSGEVNQAGKFEMRGQLTALQAVMTAGGFKESAKVSQIVVFRKLNEEMAEVKTLNLKKIKKTSDLENDLILESGDIIFVPRNAFSKIEKYVRLSAIGAILNPLAR